MPDYVHELRAEYLYRHHVIPGLPREAYLDEPGDVIEWMTRIHDAETRAEAKRARRSS